MHDNAYGINFVIILLRLSKFLFLNARVRANGTVENRRDFLSLFLCILTSRCLIARSARLSMPELKVLNRGIRPNDPSRPKISIAGSNLFTKLHKSDPELIHEVTIAVNQRNLDLIHDILMERSQPGHTNYQKWLSFSEIHSLIRNDEAVKAIRSWVKEAGGKIISVTPHGDYIRAAASICTWERALDAKFYCWEHIKTSTSSSLSTTSSSSSMRSRIYHRAESYSIPAHMQAHISAIFRTSQAPVIPRRHGQKRPYQATPAAGADANMPRNRSSAFPYGLTGDSRPSSLNLMYGITSNTGRTLELSSNV